MLALTFSFGLAINILFAVSDDARDIAVTSDHGGRGKEASDLGESHFQCLVGKSERLKSKRSQ